MMGYWWLFLLGLLGGWLIELAIDYTWWRKRHRAAAEETTRRFGEIEQLRKELESRDTRLALRERDAGERETVQSGRDADLLLQAKRVDERGEAILRTEQRLDARRVELEKLAASLGERERVSNDRLSLVRLAEARFEERQTELDAADVEASKREAMLGSRESGIKRWEQRVLTKEKELHGLEAEAARAARDAERWRRQYHGMRALIDQRYRRDDGADDLTVIHGIDRRAEALLNDLGINSFARLAETPLGELSRLAEQGGPRLALTDPMSWAEQAVLLLDRDFIGFEALKARLRGDVPADAAIAATDITLESGPPLVDEDDSRRPDTSEVDAATRADGADGEHVFEVTDDSLASADASVEPEAEALDGGDSLTGPSPDDVSAAAEVAVDDPGPAQARLHLDAASGVDADLAGAGTPDPLALPDDAADETGREASGPEAAASAVRAPRGRGRAARAQKPDESAQPASAQAGRGGDDFEMVVQESESSAGEAEAVESALASAAAPAPNGSSRQPQRPPQSGQPPRGGGRRRRR